MPRETAIGPDRVAVRRGGEQSIAMPFLVEAANPSVFMHVGASSLIVQTVADGPTAGPAGVASQLAPGRPSVAATPARQLLETAAIRLGTVSVADRPRPFLLDRRDPRVAMLVPAEFDIRLPWQDVLSGTIADSDFAADPAEAIAARGARG